MKLRKKDQFFARDAEKEYSVSQALNDSLSGTAYWGNGIEDRIRYNEGNLENTINAISALVEKLHEKGLLSDDEVLEMMTGFEKVDED